MSSSFTFSAEVWEYNGENSWHFVTVPLEIGEAIKSIAEFKRGFGSVRVLVSLGTSKWQTSLFPDSKSESYLLPLKKEIRLKEQILAGETIKVSLLPLQV